MTRREIVYAILTEIKSLNGDSYITEELIMFLMNIYRLALIEMKRKLDKKEELDDSYYLLICVDVSMTDLMPDSSCGQVMLRSELAIPGTVKDTNLLVTPSPLLTIINPDTGLEEILILPYDYFSDNIVNVSRERFKNVGYLKFLRNFIYTTKGLDDHLYIKSNNPLYQYLTKVKVSGVFEDTEKADELSCVLEGEDNECPDILDREYPIAAELVPLMMLTIVLELKTALYTLGDTVNDSADTIADLMSYIRRNMKNNFLKLIEG